MGDVIDLCDSDDETDTPMIQATAATTTTTTTTSKTKTPRRQDDVVMAKVEEEEEEPVRETVTTVKKKRRIELAANNNNNNKTVVASSQEDISGPNMATDKTTAVSTLISRGEKEKKNVAAGRFTNGNKNNDKTTDHVRAVSSAAKSSQNDDHTKKVSTTTSTKQPSKKPTSAPKCHDPVICIDSSDDEALQPSKPPPPKKDEHNKCWKCNVPLRHPYQESYFDLCCYAMHTHPLLQTPICWVCNEEVEAVEIAAIQQEPTSSNTSCCSCCGGREEEEEETLFLCDACPRAICKICLLQAHGSDAADIVIQLLQEDDDAEWRCCICDPPAALKKLQQHLVTLQDRPDAPSKSKEDLLIELRVVEQKKKECEQLWEQEEETRTEIRQELLEKGVHDREVEEQVEEEMECWKEKQGKHELRLTDMISTLQEELESRHNFNLKEFYHDDEDKQQNSITSETAEPSWKQAADKEIAIRERQELLKSPTPEHNPLYDVDDIDQQDIDELESLSSKDNDDSSREDLSWQWRNSRNKVTKPELQRALQLEDEYLVAKKIPVVSHFKESDDRQAMLEENRQRSRDRYIRRDRVVAVRRRREDEEEKISKAKRKASDLPSSSAAHARKAAALRLSRQEPIVEEEESHSDEVPTTPNDADIHARTPTALRLSRQEPIIEEEESHSDGVPTPRNDADLFDNSSLVLTEDDNDYRPISIARPLAEKLKPHQREGIQFMFLNSFSDLACKKKEDANLSKEKNIGGCILAHNMGTGKTLCTVALLHSLLYHPSLYNTATRRGEIHTVLLIVPVNTLRNWENEVEEWTGEFSSTIPVYNLSEQTSYGGVRQNVIKKWSRKGGILLTSDNLFKGLIKKQCCLEQLQSPGPDVIVLDEAHTMLKNTDNLVFKALIGVQTLRRICLTGSPFQNNLLEYFRMVSYIRPGLLGTSERKFEKDYVEPILEGNVADASDAVKQYADGLLFEIQENLRPYVNRKDASVLLQDLPGMQQVVLHVRRTKVQSRLYGAFAKFRKNNDWNNFLKIYTALRPIHNHPACLLLSKEAKSEEMMAVKASRKNSFTAESATEIQERQASRRPSVSQDEDVKPTQAIKQEATALKTKNPSKDDGTTKSKWDIIDLISDAEEEDLEAEVQAETGQWWKNVARRCGDDKLADVTNGNKVVLLLHILVHATMLDEKVVVFSQCLKTLDFISEVLAMKNWQKQVPSLASSFPEHPIGGWKAGRDFLRIDGSISGSERGDLIQEFNEDLSSVRLFLISSRAGGIGINLCSANRVVLFDSHFNPTVDTQALYRCYRYGQKRRVFAYRFLTEGTMEEKVYSRAVNKSGLALRLLDGKSVQRCFTKDEVADLVGRFDWVQCNRCDKWRVFPPESNVDVEALPDEWFCEMMNKYDKRMIHDCSFPEQEQSWYNRHFKKPNEISEFTSPVLAISGDSTTKVSKEKTAKLVARDEILKGLLEVLANETNSTAIAKHYFHDALLEEKEIEEKGSSDQAVAGLKGFEQSERAPSEELLSRKDAAKDNQSTRKTLFPPPSPDSAVKASSISGRDAGTTEMKGTEQSVSTTREELPCQEDMKSNVEAICDDESDIVTTEMGTEQTDSTPSQELPSHEDKQSPKKRLFPSSNSKSPSSNSSSDSAIVAMAKASARRRLDLGSGLSKASSVDYGASGETEVKDSGTVPSQSGSKRTLTRSNGQNATSPQPRKKVKPAEEDEISVFIKGKKRVLTSPPQKIPKEKGFNFPKRVLPKFLRGVIKRKES